MVDNLPPPIEGVPSLQPVEPPAGSPDHARKSASKPESEPTAEAAVSPIVATLDFELARSKSIELDYPFQFEGRRIDTIVVRRLSMGAVNRLVADERHRDLHEVYAEMTGLPAAVLRGLDGDDGIRVAEVAYDFLPRLLREAHATS